MCHWGKQGDWQGQSAALAHQRRFQAFQGKNFGACDCDGTKNL